ncbi:hypothetical protein Tco_1336764 [Tanacetum coccineum]
MLGKGGGERLGDVVGIDGGCDVKVGELMDGVTPKQVCKCASCLKGGMKEEMKRYIKRGQICCGQFITKIDRKSKVLTDDVIRNLSALIYCRDFDTTILREFIDSQGRLILEDQHLCVPRVCIPRPPRASMQDRSHGDTLEAIRGWIRHISL